MAEDADYEEVHASYLDALIRARRDSLHHLAIATIEGWSLDEFRRWVQTGEQPEGKRVFE